MKFFVLIIALMTVACGSSSATIDDANEDAAPDQRTKLVPDAAPPPADSSPPPEPDAGEDAPDGVPGTCPAPVVSLSPGALCGPQGPGQVCGTSGTVYVCHGAYRPAIEGCLFQSRVVDPSGSVYTRSLCQSDFWSPVEDPQKECLQSFPLRFYAPNAGGTQPNVIGCISTMSTWFINGASGTIYCCRNS